jgi:hypothetical protein
LLAWRMALAKNMFRQNDSGVTEIAECVPQARSAPHSPGLPPARMLGADRIGDACSLGAPHQ